MASNSSQINTPFGSCVKNVITYFNYKVLFCSMLWNTVPMLQCKHVFSFHRKLDQVFEWKLLLPFTNRPHSSLTSFSGLQRRFSASNFQISSKLSQLTNDNINRSTLGNFLQMLQCFKSQILGCFHNVRCKVQKNTETCKE